MKLISKTMLVFAVAFQLVIGPITITTETIGHCPAGAPVLADNLGFGFPLTFYNVWFVYSTCTTNTVNLWAQLWDLPSLAFNVFYWIVAIFALANHEKIIARARGSENA